MRPVLLSLIALLPAALAAAISAAEPRTPGAVELDYGYFCAHEPVEEGVAEGTISGTVNFIEGLPVFQVRDTRVPGGLGISFGIHVLVQPRFAGAARVHVDHPPMGPDGITRQSWTTELSALEHEYLGYTFDYPYEVLPGRWTLSAEAAGQEIYAITFEVMDPARLPPLACGPAHLS
jgi:hypothetical protein